MKVLGYYAVLFSFWIICGGLRTFQFKINSQLIEAVDKIAAKVFALNITTLNIVLPSSSKSFAINDFKRDFITKVLSHSEVAVRLESPNNIRMISGKRRRFNFFLVESFIQLADICAIIKPQNFWFNGFYLIVILHASNFDCEIIFKMLWELQIFNVLVAFSDETNSVRINTFIPFNSKRCNDTTPILINVFESGRFLNGVENLFIDKMKNLHGCPIRVSVTNDSQPFIFVKVLTNGSYALSGQIVNFFNTISEALNFHINYTYIGIEGDFNEQDTSKSALGEILNGNADLSLSNWWIKIFRLKYFDITTPTASERLIFVIPSGRDFSPIEKLIFPFTPSVRILIVMCFVLGLIVIFIIKFLPHSVQNFVFGTGVRNPYLNILIGWTGGTQPVLPKRNFARFILMMFLMFSLVMRTVYQGSYYRLLYSSRQHKEIQTIDEMVEKDFKFYVYSENADMFKGEEEISKRFYDYRFVDNKAENFNFRLVSVTAKEIGAYLKKIQSDSTFKGAFGRSFTRIVYLNDKTPEGLRHRICKDVLLTTPCVLYTRKDFFLLDEMNKNIRLLKASGLVNFWNSKYSEGRISIARNSQILKVLTLQDLSGCIQVFVFGCISSLVIFVVELMSVILPIFRSH